MPDLIYSPISSSCVCVPSVNVFEATFRPDPANSVAEDMYPQTENPSPAAELLNQLYATHHEGVAKIWVQDDTDIAAMRGTLEVSQCGDPVKKLVCTLTVEWRHSSIG